MNPSLQNHEALAPAPSTLPSKSFHGLLKTFLEQGEAFIPETSRTVLGSPHNLVKAVRMKLSRGVLQVMEYSDHTVSVKLDGEGFHDSILFNWDRTAMSEDLEEIYESVSEAVRILLKE